MAGGFGEADVPGDDRGIDLTGEMTFDLLRHLHGKVGPSVKHGEDHPLQINVRIQGPLYDAYGREKVAEAFQSVVFALNGNQNGVCGAQCVEGEKFQRGGTVHKDVVIFLMEGSQSILEQIFPPGHTDHLHSGPGQSLVGGDHIGPDGGDDGFPAVGIVDQHIVDGGGRGGLIDPKSRSGIGLWVKVADQDATVQGLECGGQVDASRGFADAAFLVDDCDGFSHGTPALFLSGGWK